MNDKFSKIYNTIISEANKQKAKWIQLPTYKGVNKYYSQKHVTNRFQNRYKRKVDNSILNCQINDFIDELLRKNAWKGVKNKKGFSFHATESNQWFSGEIQKEQKTSKKEIFIATFLPPEDTSHNSHNIIIRLPI